jgi:hypothetical protein
MRTMASISGVFMNLTRSLALALLFGTFADLRLYRTVKFIDTYLIAIIYRMEIAEQ